MEPVAMIFILIIMSFVSIIPALIVYFIYRLLKKRGYNKIAYALAIGFVVLFFYACYRQIIPSDSFFIDEFERYTEIKYPKSADIEYKSISSPDIHGKSNDCVRFRLSSEEYKKLFATVANANNLVYDEGPESNICDCTQTIPPALICVKAFKLKAPFPTAESIIYFYNDKRTVVAYFRNY